MTSSKRVYNSADMPKLDGTESIHPSEVARHVANFLYRSITHPDSKTRERYLHCAQSSLFTLSELLPGGPNLNVYERARCLFFRRLYSPVYADDPATKTAREEFERALETRF